VTFFHVTDRNITLHDSKPNLVEELPNGTYGLRFSPETGVYLEVIEPFDMPEKLYGDISERAERPNVTGDFEVDLDGDEENDEGVKTTVKAGKNNTLIVNDKDGHKLILKRVKVNYRKTF
jgi:hypothetical protein